MAGQFDGEYARGQRRAHRARSSRRHADERPAPAPPGSQCPATPPKAPPRISSGARTPPDVPDPSATSQTIALTTSSPSIAVSSIRSVEQVPGCRHSRRRARAARSGPPSPTTMAPSAGHHIQWIGSRWKPILDPIERGRQQAPPPDRPAQTPSDAASDSATAPAAGRRRRMETAGRCRSTAVATPNAVSTPTTTRHEAARLPFEQQHFDRQQDRRDRRAEDRRHPGGRTGDQQRLALGARSGGSTARTASRSRRRS